MSRQTDCVVDLEQEAVADMCLSPDGLWCACVFEGGTGARTVPSECIEQIGCDSVQLECHCRT